ncbi:MAG: hypothetical protein KH436_06805 [Firmicutes bacterium]|nr:hypothetical protein [Bacillota bacterium]
MAELLAQIGFTEDEIADFVSLEKSKRFREQELLLRKHRNRILSHIHSDEKLLADVDYLIHEIEKKVKQEVFYEESNGRT